MLAMFVFHNVTRHKIMNLFTFSRYFKHVDLYTFDGTGWIGFRFGTKGMEYLFSGYFDSVPLIEAAKAQPTTEAVIVIDVAKGCRFPWRPLTIPMCNEFARYIAKPNIGFTWSPRHLYNKLIKYDQIRNYDVIVHWRQDARQRPDKPGE